MNTINIESIKDDNNQQRYRYEALFDRINFMIHCLQQIQIQNENLTNKIEKIEKVINGQLKNNKSFKKRTQVKKTKEISKGEESKTNEKVETNTKSSSNVTDEKQKAIIVTKIIKPKKNDEKNKIKIIKNQEKVKATKQIKPKEKKSAKIKINKEVTETTTNESKSKNSKEEKTNQTIEFDEEIFNKEITDIEKNSRKERRIINRQNAINFHIGYMGEAYIYENLIHMGCFSKVEWNANTKDENNPSVTTRDGTKYFIQEDGGHYDIYAEDYENQKYYFEIKSTDKDHKSNHISSAQKNFFLNADQKDTYLILAKVTNVFKIPSIEYCLYDHHNGFKKIEINKEKTEKYFVKRDFSQYEDDETDLIKISKKQSNENKNQKKTTKKKNNQSLISSLFSKNMKKLRDNEKKNNSSHKKNKKTKA